MGGKKKRNRDAASMAMAGRGGLQEAQYYAQEQYEADMAGLRDASNVTDYYADLNFKGIDPSQLSMQKTREIEGLGTLDSVDPVTGRGYTSQGYGDKQLGYTAGTTSEAGLARGAGTGLSNVFNNLQVSTAGADLAAQEADQSLAASQEAMMMMGGGGGATALAAQAAKSKAGISADIDRQVKANEMMRAQGEQGLQRDLLAQGNLASQFGLGQAQFNVGAQNQAAQFSQAAQNQAYQFDAAAANAASQFSMNALNQADQFNASQANNRALQKFGAENEMNQFNANASNNAFANQANAINNAIAQNASDKLKFDFGKAGGQSQAQSNRYDALMGIAEISTNQLNEADRELGANTAVVQQGAMSKGWWQSGNPYKDALTNPSWVPPRPENTLDDIPGGGWTPGGNQPGG